MLPSLGSTRLTETEENHMKTTSKDPYWLTLRYRGHCRRCNAEIKPGEKAFYFPLAKIMYCDFPKCGQAESRAFADAAQAEAF